MTAEEKTSLARFLDLAGDYLGDGHARKRENYAFDDDAAPPDDAAVSNIPPGKRPERPFAAAPVENLPPVSIPLAYTTEEDGGGESPYSREYEDSREYGDSLEKTAADIAVCGNCALAAGRTLAVPGEGAPAPLVLVIGEGPGQEEDLAGRPFVGRAGQLLDRMLASIGVYRGRNCFIANMVKCRPPENRDPEPGEIAACYPYLERQIALLRPKVILCAGRIAAQSLLKTDRGVGALRGQFAEITAGGVPIPALPTFHPSAILRDDSLRRPAWEDLKLLRARLAALDADYAALSGNRE
jgi:DNA polymerase